METFQLTPVFNFEKSIHAILYIVNRLQRKDFHKIFKIIYFADREHLSEYGRPITGDSYIAMEDGPVPSNIYDVFKSLRGDGFFADKSNQFSDFFVVKNWNFIEPKKDANTYYLSESEIEILDLMLQKYGSLSWDEIREKSHDYAWVNTIKDRTISLVDIMLENGEKDEYIAYVDTQIKLQKACF